MLTSHEQEAIKKELPKYATTRAVVPEALRIVQEQRGWVSDESVADIAAYFGMTTEEVDSIATFYPQIYRQPVGRHVILICNSVSCWVMGYNPLREFLGAKLGITLGETTPDGRFTLLPVVCLGDCDHAPVMMVDARLYGELSEERIDGDSGGVCVSDGTTADRTYQTGARADEHCRV